MSEGMNELERSLRQLEPSTASTGPILYEMGRASAMRAARIWRGTALAGIATSLLLGVLWVTRPEPAVRIEIVPVPPVEAPPQHRPTEPSEPIVSAEPPMPEWRLQHHHVTLRSERISDPADADVPRDLREPLGVGDVLKGPLVWSVLANVGER